MDAMSETHDRKRQGPSEDPKASNQKKRGEKPAKPVLSVYSRILAAQKEIIESDGKEITVRKIIANNGLLLLPETDVNVDGLCITRLIVLNVASGERIEFPCDNESYLKVVGLVFSVPQETTPVVIPEIKAPPPEKVLKIIKEESKLPKKLPMALFCTHKDLRSKQGYAPDPIYRGDLGWVQNVCLSFKGREQWESALPIIKTDMRYKNSDEFGKRAIEDSFIDLFNKFANNYNSKR